MVQPKVRYGYGAVDALPRVVAELGASRVLLICGKRSFEASGAARVLPELERVATVLRWSDFAPNTDAADLVRVLAAAADFRPDLVLAVGGGSAMDLAKLVCAYDGQTDQEALHAAIRSGARVSERRVKLVLVPTTSGSGAETTHFAVVYIGDDKYSVAGPVLRPDAVVLDPGLTVSGSAYQRATSGIDAVTQAIESLWAVGATPTSRRWARHALGYLLPAIEPFVTTADTEAARAMSIGSHLAGRAIDISKTTVSHALSYGITKRYGVSHGHAVSLTLGVFLEAHADAPPERLRPGVDPASHTAAMAEILTALGVADGAEARARFTTLLHRIGLETDLAKVGAATPQDRQALAESVNAERLGNNPVRFTTADLTALLEAAAGNRPAVVTAG